MVASNQKVTDTFWVYCFNQLTVSHGNGVVADGSQKETVSGDYGDHQIGVNNDKPFVCIGSSYIVENR